MAGEVATTEGEVGAAAIEVKIRAVAIQGGIGEEAIKAEAEIGEVEAIKVAAGITDFTVSCHRASPNLGPDPLTEIVRKRQAARTHWPLQRVHGRRRDTGEIGD